MDKYINDFLVEEGEHLAAGSYSSSPVNYRMFFFELTCSQHRGAGKGQDEMKWLPSRRPILPIIVQPWKDQFLPLKLVDLKSGRTMVNEQGGLGQGNLCCFGLSQVVGF